MLKILIPTLMMVPTTWLTPRKWLWPTALYQSLFLAFLSLSWLKNTSQPGWHFINSYMATDNLSTPLLILSCWLLPLMIMASQNHMSSNPVNQQRTYITLLILLQFFLILAFSATDFILFFVSFEATLLPTLAVITRWGNQKDRLNAGTYFLFYTLAGSLPLLIALLSLHGDTGTLSLLALQMAPTPNTFSYTNKLWWLACMLAFLVKLPLYGVHLWLPKAHVEAPIAGSMVLAAVLLKLGGYGLMRIVPLLTPLTPTLSYPFMILALWGGVMTASICTRQTDLKSLIAYSSVGHMGLAAAGILTQSSCGFSGAMMLMIAHGLTSSALFCLANVNYERTHSRTLTLARGLQTLLPLMTLWWFLAVLANLALPPLPNLMGELLIMTSLFGWSYWTIIFTGLAALITAAYSLFMFLMTQRGQVPAHIKFPDPSFTREHLLMTFHILPLLLLILNPSLITIS
uniref:NADH dehydrogenase subunit 4 n=1 Tax=Synchiropus atrilabiatus TaxID=875780 RepID=UPI0028FC9486|nr:NADH dehydrogenase subunit 4 [Synchiropus atrilabiatus]WNH37726.1 NADH dehydrogenase subunit 4 [Synchiropus atrilabiatus]